MVETSLEGIIATLNKTLSFVREQDGRQREEKILLHRPRQVDGMPGETTDVQIPHANVIG